MTLFLIILGVFGVVCALVAWSACALSSSEWSLPDDAELADYPVDSAEESEFYVKPYSHSGLKRQIGGIARDG
jgi:hypothetical protein